MSKPFSQACENNKQPILEILTHAFSNKKHVLEVGSGTGQHGVYFAKNLPSLMWQTSDLPVNHSGINQWIDEQPVSNLQRPLVLDLAKPQPLNINIDAIFTANTLHIISLPLVQNFFNLVKSQLTTSGTLCIYGPFNYQGKYTSESNANFDLWLKARDEQSGIRDLEAVCQLAAEADLLFQEAIKMPANNQILLFQKK